MKRLISQFYSQVSTTENNKFIPVKIWEIVMVLSILGGGVVLSLVILFVEIVMHRRWKIVSNRAIAKNLALASGEVKLKEYLFCKF